MKRRVRLMLDLYKNLRHRYGFTGLNIPTTGHGFRTPLPKIKCELCLEWEHKILGGDEVPSLLAVGKAHLKSPGHPVEYDEEEVKEYVVWEASNLSCKSTTADHILVITASKLTRLPFLNAYKTPRATSEAPPRLRIRARRRRRFSNPHPLPRLPCLHPHTFFEGSRFFPNYQKG
jgi:hypothetical protein